MTRWFRGLWGNKHLATVRKPLRKRALQVETLEDRCVPAAVTWDGGGDGSSWQDPLNWSGDAVPGVADQVQIDQLGNTTVVVHGDLPAVGSLDNRALLRIA